METGTRDTSAMKDLEHCPHPAPAPQETPAQHSPLPWPEPILENDVGPSDEGYWEWWEIEGIAKFDREQDARFARQCVNRDPAFQKLLKAAQFALTTPGLIKGRDGLQKAVDEAIAGER